MRQGNIEQQQSSHTNSAADPGHAPHNDELFAFEIPPNGDIT